MNSDKSRGVLRTQANIYDEAFFKFTLIIFTKNSIIDSRLGFKKAPENKENFQDET